MERAAREIWAHPEGLQGRDQGVSSEERHEPRQPGGRQHVGLVGERPFDPQRREVDDRLVEDGLERGAVGLEPGHCVEPPRQRPFRGLLLLAEVLVHRLQHGVVQLELDPHDGSEQLPRRELELPDEAVAVDAHRGVGELLERRGVEDAATHHAHGAGRAKPGNLVGEPHRPTVRTVLTRNPLAPVTNDALHLEQVGEVRPARQPQLEPRRLQAGVDGGELLEQAVAHEAEAAHRDRVRAQTLDLGIRQIERGRVVVDRAGLEERQGSPLESHLPPVEEARVVVNEAAHGAGRHVTERVGEKERTPLQHRDRIRAELRRIRLLVTTLFGRARLWVGVERRRTTSCRTDLFA